MAIITDKNDVVIHALAEQGLDNVFNVRKDDSGYSIRMGAFELATIEPKRAHWISGVAFLKDDFKAGSLEAAANDAAIRLRNHYIYANGNATFYPNGANASKAKRPVNPD